jgi:chromosomal replication initiator protein
MIAVPFWQEWIGKIQEMLSEKVFEEHFTRMEPVNYNGQLLQVALLDEDDPAKLQLLFGGILEMAYREASAGQNLQIQLVLPPAPPAGEDPNNEASSGEGRFVGDPGITLNRDFTFDSFVEGKNSQFAVSAARAVAESPGGSKFNPLLIYGGVGLGKTHLLQAIGNEIQRRAPHRVVRYVATEAFVSEYISAVQNKRIEEMSFYYRNEVDLLLMDDIQFLEGKPETQNEFFHIFNALHQAGRQIVLTSDNPPSEVVGIQDRLISRFQWGLNVDIQPPDVETREAILRKKAQKMRLELPDDVIRAISTHVEGNVRQLEGVVRSLLLRSTVARSEITLDMVGEVLNTVPRNQPRRVSVDEVLQAISEHFEVDVDRVLESGRGTKEVALARQTAMYLLRRLTALSHKSIGKRFGNRDHSTVVHAIKTVEKLIREDQVFKSGVQMLQGRLT